ncbi:MAG: M81 family metallopeptidase [Gammaproteobacteria bacterium]|nr:M81 family metallopeptidase [Gammaproteobacteria bacterium]
MTIPPRIALCGIILESNAFAPVATEDDFRGRYYFEGDEILDQAAEAHSVMPMEMSAFVRAMHATGPWSPAPLVLTGCQPWGPVDSPFFNRTVDAIIERLDAGGPVDGVYVANHGGMTATEDHDPDGEMLARIRAAVGDQVPIIATLDLHANISDRMIESSDVLIGYQTNPHVDMLERGEEAAFVMRLLLSDVGARSKLVRLPIVAPSVTLLTASGPYGVLMDLAQRRKRELGGAILNASVFGGFAFSDTPKNGLAVVITGRDDDAPAGALAVEIAEHAWQIRDEFKKTLTSMEEGVAMALEIAADPFRPPVIFSDSGDNPGGGGGGDTPYLLKALVDAGAKGVLYGSFFDPALAAEAHRRGPGARFKAVFNRKSCTGYGERLEVAAQVQALSDGDMVGRRGIFAGRRLVLGSSAVLEIGGEGGIRVVVISARQQTADPMFFEMFGLDVAAARVVCVKSRGHFRAGFDLWFSPPQVHEIDTPGLTSPVLERHLWRGLPRPVYPLDEDVCWPHSGPV